MKSLIRFLVGLLMPVILIGLGAGITGLGVTYEMTFIIYAGFGLIGAGILWGIFIFLWASEGSL